MNDPCRRAVLRIAPEHREAFERLGCPGGRVLDVTPHYWFRGDGLLAKAEHPSFPPTPPGHELPALDWTPPPTGCPS